MEKLLATIKAPVEKVSELTEQLKQYEVKEVEVIKVPYEKFIEESRLNYDCAYPRMWEDKKDVAYINFSFDATEEGRKESFDVEYNLMQIPINLRYDFES